MKKEVKRFKIDYSLDWEDELEIKKIKADIEAIERLIEALVERIETDEEFNIRVAEVNRRLEENKRRELELFEKLKLKYGMEK